MGEPGSTLTEEEVADLEEYEYRTVGFEDYV